VDEAGDELSSAQVMRSVLGDLFEAEYLELLDLYGEDLSEGVVLHAFAELLESLLARGEEAALERCCQALEVLANGPTAAGADSAYLGVVLILSPPALERLRSYLHPTSEELLEAVEREEVLGECES
jgi:hypothetical protein